MKCVEKIGVFDLDETVFNWRIIGKVLLHLSQKLVEIAIMLQKPNKDVTRKMRHCDKIIILSARSKDQLLKVTLRQLSRHRLPFSKVILFPTMQYTMEWKRDIIERLGNVEWHDDWFK